ncbi:nonsense-mediated mRNA decay factor SMG8-like [Tubulanus polymorphus]|uniref:nonsense-mediated mRNA decay factor SMG8-like n=1 Tax=Tubulanus polymorphus TaxID=672921 RepID=UPI003DA4496C
MDWKLDYSGFNYHNDFKELDDKVCVVSIVGKSQILQQTSKASFLNNLVGKTVFVNENNDGFREPKEQVYFEYYYDKHLKVLYVHMKSSYDSSLLANETQNLQEYENGLKDMDFKYAKGLLFLFSISHIILFIHPGSSFDVSYIRLFRIMDSMRIKLQPHITDELKGFPISKDWILAARPCSPRVLFYFEKVTLGSSFDLDHIHLQTKQIPLKYLQHEIEDQIYRILRKSRVITNISNHSLFAVPANHEFVFIHDGEQLEDPLGFYLTQLKHSCCQQKETGLRPDSYQTRRRNLHSIDNPKQSSSHHFSSHNMWEFLWQHINLALTKGFEDNVNRRNMIPVQAVFELPSIGTWFDVADKLHNFFLGDNEIMEVEYTTLKAAVEIDASFSESRCLKVLPLAESAYQDGLPQFYPKSYHLKKLAQAKKVFLLHARGPACERYVDQLEKSCNEMWFDGRRQCEKLSMTGKSCLLELHQTDESETKDFGEMLPIMMHSSKLKTVSYCNCGRKKCERDDPFDHKAANFDFYQNLSISCCGKLEEIKLPSFQPSTTNAKAAAASQDVHSCDIEMRDKAVSTIENLAPDLSLALSLGQSGDSIDLYGHKGHTGQKGFGGQMDTEMGITTDAHVEIIDHSHEKDSTDEDDYSDGDRTPEPIFRHKDGDTCLNEEAIVPDKEQVQHQSTTEYLPFMLNSKSPPGLLPKFNSWSLHILGRYTSYSHAQGLDQMGFLHNTNFLLPWDVFIKVDQEKWPLVAETKKGKGKKAFKDSGEISLKVFIGIEYECPRGHRFFMSSPDKILKANAGSLMKESALKLISSDMPLYHPCQCRSSKGYMAQIMRCYVASPEGPMQVILDPLVRAGPLPSSPLFKPGNQSPFHLPPGVISVLRFPYVYIDENGPYLMPADSQQRNACHLLKGLFSYSHILQK